MATTTNFGLTLLEAAQAQKEITINQALTGIDAALSGVVVDKDLTAPPSSPATNAMYIVGPSPTGAWAGHANALAYFQPDLEFYFAHEPARAYG